MRDRPADAVRCALMPAVPASEIQLEGLEILAVPIAIGGRLARANESALTIDAVISS